MADKPIGQDLPENKSEVQNTEERPVTDIPESKEKAAAPVSDDIAIVKSKIREKSAVQAPVESEDNMIDKPKSSSTKINRVQRRGKKLKAKSSDTFEPQESEGDELKTEMSSDVQQPLNDESKLSVKLSSVSKKSAVQMQAATKSSKKLATQEGSEEKPSENQPKTQNHLADASLSTFVISHDVEQTKEENAPSDVPEIQDEAQTRAIPQKHIHERGNYMNNMSPSPIEDYSPNNKAEAEAQKKN